MRMLRRRPSPAFVVALLALFVALGGPAQAKKLIDGKLLKKGSVTGRAIKNGSLNKGDLSKAAIRSLEATPTSSVRSAQIVDGQVLAPDLGAGAVTAPALAAGSITASKLAPDSIGGGSVANGSLQTSDIGSFAGAISVPSVTFASGALCHTAVAQALPVGGSPNIQDDVILVTPPANWPDQVLVTAKPAPDNSIRIQLCLGDPTDPTIPLPYTTQGPYIFRYVTFDSP
jgi:hypothetical protein